jgi:hypothetical protein
MFDLYYIFSSFLNLPNWLRNTVYVLAALSMLGVGLAFTPTIAVMVAIGLLFVVVVLGVYAYALKAHREKRQAALSQEIEQNTVVAPRGINDPKRRADLDSMRKKFQEGLDKFSAAGKSLYKLPWYVVVGEPAAGKTEAIRHCEVGFPPGLQDYHQGTGGTINMHWWFTDHAVILDTAGRIMFEEVPAGSSSEWREFLKLLRKHRPNCPINGLMLVIPVDRLIKDGVKDIETRAGWIAKQLDVIQRELDIRFPVYVVLSKCDLLHGFREFFAEADVPDIQRQMLGWSNPNPLDMPFQPDMVDQYIFEVVERLRQRRLPLLSDPVARTPGGRRADEVDRLFTLPNSLAMIAENLRRYLSTIFIAGEWSSKPLFLRGIYFTSSLREGFELDQELAQAVGLPLEDLPAGGAFERDISYFLRDLFIEKIFREWGLVTRASDTRRMLRQRKAVLLACGFGGLALLLLFSWFGYSAMRDSIGRQSGYWMRASEDWQPDDTWMPIVKGDQNAGYQYMGDAPVGRGARAETRNLFRGGDQSLVEFHASLAELAQQSLHISPVFRPFTSFAGNLDADRLRAQRVVLEGSVIKPLLEATRAKIVVEPETSDPAKVGQALLELVRLESGIVKRNAGRSESIEAPRDMADSLEGYLLSRNIDPVLGDVIDSTYTKGDGRNRWPEDRLSGGGTLSKDNPAYNAALDVGIEHFRLTAMHSFSKQDDQWRVLQEIANFTATDFEPAERNLFQAVNAPADVIQLHPLLLEPYNVYHAKEADLEKRVADARALGLFSDGRVSLYDAYEYILSQRKNQAVVLKSWIDKMLAETIYGETQVSHPSPLLNEVQDRLNTILNLTQAEPEGLDVALLKRLDDEEFNQIAARGSLFEYRAKLYDLCLRAAQQGGNFHDLIGKDWEPISESLSALDSADKSVADYQASHKDELAALCAYWLNYAKIHQIAACCTEYLAEARAALRPYARFPVTWPPAPEDDSIAGNGDLVMAAHEVRTIKHDLRDDGPYSQIPADQRHILDVIKSDVAAMGKVLDALVLPGDKLNGVIVSMVADVSQYQVDDTPVMRAQPVGQTGPVMAPPAPPAPASFELRKLTYHLSEAPGNQKSGMVGNYGVGHVPIGKGMNLNDTPLPIDTLFHFHYYPTGWSRGDAWVEDQSAGESWCALRMLQTCKDASVQLWDNADWQVVAGDKHPPVTLNLHFDAPLPPRSQWPTKDSLKLDE